MRLLVVGRLSGQLSAAVQMAMATGAKVAHVDTCAKATHALRAGQGADLLMVDYDLDIAALIAANERSREGAAAIRLHAPSDAVRRLLTISGVTAVLIEAEELPPA